MNKAYVMAMIFFTFNLILIWFDLMGFFAYQPIGEDVIPDYTRFGFYTTSWSFWIFAGLGIAIIGGFISKFFVNINAFSMILFMEAFWLPFLASINVISKVFLDVPDAFKYISIIFFALMTAIFIYALIEMNSGTTVTG